MASVLGPIDTLPLFPDLGAGLVALLGSLSPSDWQKPTIHRDRNVKDLASHLLDTALRRLAMQRDGWFAEGPASSDWNGLVAFIQRMNREWMDVTRRLSPRLLVDMMARTEGELATHLASLPPNERAMFSVAWAGEAESENWFDVAREYTERWHHQQQIRDAVGQPGFGEPRFLQPVIATFARGLPHAYRAAGASEGAAVAIEIDGERWVVQRSTRGWALVAEADVVTATISMKGDDAWRLWTKELSADEARSRSEISGDEALVAPAFSFVAIMA